MVMSGFESATGYPKQNNITIFPQNSIGSVNISEDDKAWKASDKVISSDSDGAYSTSPFGGIILFYRYQPYTRKQSQKGDNRICDAKPLI
jgi:hypothetical protein